MKFAQFHVGQVIEAGPYHVTADEILSFARKWDPQWFHTDPEAAEHGHFGGLIASGIHTLAIAMHMVVPAVLEGSECLASPGGSSLKWPRPVRPGDDLRLTITIESVRRARSNPTTGVVDWRWQLFNQNDEEVMNAVLTNLFRLPA